MVRVFYHNILKFFEVSSNGLPKRNYCWSDTLPSDSLGFKAANLFVQSMTYNFISIIPVMEKTVKLPYCRLLREYNSQKLPECNSISISCKLFLTKSRNFCTTSHCLIDIRHSIMLLGIKYVFSNNHNMETIILKELVNTLIHLHFIF